jgi:hypothetical protein
MSTGEFEFKLLFTIGLGMQGMAIFYFHVYRKDNLMKQVVTILSGSKKTKLILTSHSRAAGVPHKHHRNRTDTHSAGAQSQAATSVAAVGEVVNGTADVPDEEDFSGSIVPLESVGVTQASPPIAETDKEPELEFDDMELPSTMEGGAPNEPGSVQQKDSIMDGLSISMFSIPAAALNQKVVRLESINVEQAERIAALETQLALHKAVSIGTLVEETSYIDVVDQSDNDKDEDDADEDEEEEQQQQEQLGSYFGHLAATPQKVAVGVNKIEPAAWKPDASDAAPRGTLPAAMFTGAELTSPQSTDPSRTAWKVDATTGINKNAQQSKVRRTQENRETGKIYWAQQQTSSSKLQATPPSRLSSSFLSLDAIDSMLNEFAGNLPGVVPEIARENSEIGSPAPERKTVNRRYSSSTLLEGDELGAALAALDAFGASIAEDEGDSYISATPSLDRSQSRTRRRSSSVSFLSNPGHKVSEC